MYTTNKEQPNKSDVTEVYNEIMLTPEQKKQLHFILVRIQDLADLKAFAKISYEQIQDLICCMDPKCLCGSTKMSLKKRLLEEARRHEARDRIEELQESSRALVEYQEKIGLFKVKAGFKKKPYDDSRRKADEIRQMLTMYKEKIKELFYEINILD